MRWISKRARAAAAIAGLLLLGAAGGPAQDGPQPPCEAAPRPDYGAPGEPPRFAVWRAGEIDPRWRPAACLGWSEADFSLMVALAGRFADPADGEAMLARFGAVSRLAGIRYWSVTDALWQVLVLDAAALDGPNPARRRADFSPEELRRGGAVYFAERDNRSTGAVVYRLRVIEATQDRIVASIENVSAVRWYFLTLFAAGTLRTDYFLERSGPGQWRFYSLMRIAAGSGGEAYAKSYVNRAAALYRHLAGMPTDAEPPPVR